MGNVASLTIARQIGESTFVKLVMVRGTPFSRIWKFSFSRPVTNRFSGSVTDTRTIRYSADSCAAIGIADRANSVQTIRVCMVASVWHTLRGASSANIDDALRLKFHFDLVHTQLRHGLAEA